VRLYINIDHAATLRQARRTDEPDPVRLAVLAELAGADGITVHLREDRRHIQDRDVVLLLRTARTAVNLELAATDEMVRLAADLHPHQATLVPELREEITTEGGLDCVRGQGRIRDAVAGLRAAGIRTSLFVDPDTSAVEAAAALGPDAVELHTGRYADHWREPDTCLEELRRAAARARAAGLAVHAGHGLTYENVGRVAALADVEELNIGHSVLSRAVFTGIGEAVREMRQRIDRARVTA
jgi:pyridoxine 5-phosphate synthase